MSVLTISCPLCADTQHICQEGLRIGREVDTFLKTEVLHLKYPSGPYPMKYGSLWQSAFAIGQYLHGRDDPRCVFYTENKWILKHKQALEINFSMLIQHTSEAPTSGAVIEVCEFNFKETR